MVLKTSLQPNGNRKWRTEINTHNKNKGGGAGGATELRHSLMLSKWQHVQRRSQLNSSSEYQTCTVSTSPICDVTKGLRTSVYSTLSQWARHQTGVRPTLGDWLTDCLPNTLKGLSTQWSGQLPVNKGLIIQLVLLLGIRTGFCDHGGSRAPHL